MKAFVLTRHGTPGDSFELRDMPPAPLGQDEVRIRVSAFGLNYADIMMRQGLYRGAPPLPYVMGYDVEGWIEEVGSGVTGFKPGDRVFALTEFGGYADQVVTSALATGHLAADAPEGMGCALATQCVTAYYAAVHAQTLMPGEKVLIHAAAGGLGTALIQYALSRDCTVIAVVGGERKAAYVRQLGAQAVIDHHREDYAAFVKANYNGRVDVIFDNIGGKSVPKGRALLAAGGRIVLLGAASLSGKKGKLALLRLAWGFGFFSPIGFLGKSQSLIGVNMLKLAEHRPDVIAHCFRQVSRLHEAGIFRPTIGRVFDVAQLVEAHTMLQDRQSIGKYVVRWPG